MWKITDETEGLYVSLTYIPVADMRGTIVVKAGRIFIKSVFIKIAHFCSWRGEAEGKGIIMIGTKQGRVWLF